MLVEAWPTEGQEVAAPPKLGHDPRFPVTGNWPQLRDDLIRFVDVDCGVQPAHLVGHSLGGHLALLAACRRPVLAAGVTLLAAPVPGGWRARSVQVMKATRLIGRVRPARTSRRRRRHRPSADAARMHFTAKAAFARWDPRMLADCGPPAPNPTASTAACARVGACRRPSAARVGDTVTRGRMVSLEGGHLFPMDSPVESAAAVLTWIEAFTNSPP